MDCALESDRTTEHDRLDGITPGKLVATAGSSTKIVGAVTQA
jgi:hypothetical protein